MNQDFLNNSKIPEHWLYWTFLSPDLLKKPLTTIDNQTINIIDPGRLNYDNGPDILNAIMNIGGILQKGDIEFHINQEDWFKHGHHEDHRYRNLILHVLWNAPEAIAPSIIHHFPHLILRHQINLPLSDWREKMNMLEHNEPWQIQKLPDSTPISPQQLKRCGQVRFNHKAERFKYWLELFSFDDVLIISLAEALGYSKNKFPFRQLLWENTPSKIFQGIPKFCRSPISVWVYLAIRANFLTTHSFVHTGIGQNPIVEEIYGLFRYFSEQGVVPNLQLPDWYFSRLRPTNNPIIRLAALAQIIFQYRVSPLFKNILQYANKRLTLKALLVNWHALLQLPFHSQFSDAIQTIFHLSVPNHQIIGFKRSRQFIINSVLPLLYIWAKRTGNFGFQQYIEGLYEEFPACEDTKLIQKAAARFSSASCQMNLYKLAIFQQGLLELIAKQPTVYPILF